MAIPNSGGGPKNYVPDGSVMQKVLLHHVHRDLKDILFRERAAKISSLSQGIWKPETNTIEITKLTGKFAAHMGQTDTKGSFQLNPEEALLLMDMGELEVTYKDIPLSVQDAMAHFLPTAAALQLYIVYSHLKRLGFIVQFHRGKSGFTRYERLIHLDQHLKARKPLSLTGSTVIDSSKTTSSFKAKKDHLTVNSGDCSFAKLSSSSDLHSPPLKKNKVERNFEIEVIDLEADNGCVDDDCHELAVTETSVTEKLKEPSAHSANKYNDSPNYKVKEAHEDFLDIYVPNISDCSHTVYQMPLPNPDSLPANINMPSIQNCQVDLFLLEKERLRNWHRQCTRHDERMHKNVCATCRKDSRFANLYKGKCRKRHSRHSDKNYRCRSIAHFSKHTRRHKSAVTKKHGTIQQDKDDGKTYLSDSPVIANRYALPAEPSQMDCRYTDQTVRRSNWYHSWVNTSTVNPNFAGRNHIISNSHLGFSCPPLQSSYQYPNVSSRSTFDFNAQIPNFQRPCRSVSNISMQYRAFTEEQDADLDFEIDDNNFDSDVVVESDSDLTVIDVEHVKDTEPVKTRLNRAKSWAEYRAILTEKALISSMSRSKGKHLWADENCTPLVKPWAVTSDMDVQTSLDIIQSADISSANKSRSLHQKVPLLIDFDVFLPNTQFKKSNPGLPNHRISVTSCEENLPSLPQLMQLSAEMDDQVPLHCAVVDGSDVSFYAFYDVIIPPSM